MEKVTPSRHQSKRDQPSAMDEGGASKKSYRPGYDLGKSLQEADEKCLKRGYIR
jgi:hypothetical protein